MTLEDFKIKYPQLENFSIDAKLLCVSCTTKSPLWFRLREVWPAQGTIIKGIFVSGRIRYMLAEHNRTLSNVGAYFATGSANGLVEGLIAWMPAGGCLDTFVKVQLNTPRQPDQETGMRYPEYALHFPVNPEVLFKYRFDMESFSDLKAQLAFERSQHPGEITDPDIDIAI